MNAILSKNVLEQAIAVSMAPVGFGKKPPPNDGFWFFAPVPATPWTYFDPPQSLVHVPEVLNAFGERAFAAHWCPGRRRSGCF